MIILKEWGVKIIDGEKKISGTFAVMNGTKEIAEQLFNTQYGNKKINFPAKLMVEIEALDKKILDELDRYFS